MKNNWSTIIPPIADHPAEKYHVKYLLRLKPLDRDHPLYETIGHYSRSGVFRTCLAMELGTYAQANSGLPWEWQPLAESGAFDDEPANDDLRRQFNEQRKFLLDIGNQIISLSEDLQAIVVDIKLH